MASTTTNLGLTKPAYSDDADISDINGNMDLIDAEAGKVRANVAANYDSSETYAVGDYCLHDGSLYKCSTTISSPEAWTAGHWTQIKITGELSALNGKIANLNIINLSTNTSIASLCASCPSGEHRYYGATVSTTFSDFPSEYGTLYHPIVHIAKRTNGYEIIINAVNGSNIPTQINGWFENNTFNWEKLALNSDVRAYGLGLSGNQTAETLKSARQGWALVYMNDSTYGMTGWCLAVCYANGNNKAIEVFSDSKRLHLLTTNGGTSWIVGAV